MEEVLAELHPPPEEGDGPGWSEEDRAAWAERERAAEEAETRRAAERADQERAWREGHPREYAAWSRLRPIFNDWRWAMLGEYHFESFLAEVGPIPGDGHEVERRDETRPFEPDNLRWSRRPAAGPAEVLAKLDDVLAASVGSREAVAKEWLSVKEVATLTGFGEEFVRKAADSGDLEAFKKGGPGRPTYRIHRDAVKKWMEADRAGQGRAADLSPPRRPAPKPPRLRREHCHFPPASP